ncbi:MAG: hypothetical protein ACI4BC_04955 [Muribaculaceae bacterium]
MKKYCFFIVLAIALLFTSCGNRNELLKYVPTDASVLAKVDVNSLKNKVEAEIVKHPELLSGVENTPAVEKLRALDIDYDKDAYFFACADDVEMGLVIPANGFLESIDEFKGKIESIGDGIRALKERQISFYYKDNVLMILAPYHLGDIDAVAKKYFKGDSDWNGNQLASIIDNSGDLVIAADIDKLITSLSNELRTDPYVATGVGMVSGMFKTVSMSVNIEGNKFEAKSKVDYADNSQIKGYLEKVFVKPSCEIPAKMYAEDIVTMFSIDGAELAKIQELRDLLTMYKDIVRLTMEQINAIYDFVAQINGPIVFTLEAIDEYGFQLAIKCKDPKPTIDKTLVATGLGMFVTPREDGYEMGDIAIICDKDYIYLSNELDDKTADSKKLSEMPYIKDNFGKSLSLSYSHLNFGGDSNGMTFNIYGSASDVDKSTMVIEANDNFIYMFLKYLAELK